ncbi:MAG: acyl-CoA dehydrogenase, partial [Ketobacteraceae bacterium]|nr:acyl-CoA dehydrogenase [Ketobacteraceae bacterium]
MEVFILLITALAALFFGFKSYWTAGALAAEMVLITAFGAWSVPALVLAWLIVGALALVMIKNPVRKKFISRPVLDVAKSVMPSISTTEQEALEAGSVSWEGSFFGGRPDWNALLNEKTTSLSDEEKAFLDGPVEEACEQLNDWEITHERYDLRSETWNLFREKGFFGMIIPKEYGGLGFSHAAHSAVVMKLATRSISAAVTVMVPNSLGPAELLLQYGKKEQRDYYLPRLAKGDEIPCFALTGPLAGSDAGAIPDNGVVCKGEFDGKEVLGVKLNWNKRYITLAPVATVLGLAFKLYDPDKLLSQETDRGVTCALIPTDLPGVNTGARHLPLNTVFMNGPTWGDDVFIPLDYLIGGEEYIGKGWMMLMNALSVGRSISLPALATGAGKLSSMTTGAYARIREQFGLPVGEFEGVQEALEQIAGLSYLMDSARQQVLHAVDNGEKPAIPSAMLKYQNTEYMRKVVGHAMDVHAGR